MEDYEPLLQFIWETKGQRGERETLLPTHPNEELPKQSRQQPISDRPDRGTSVNGDPIQGLWEMIKCPQTTVGQ